jgi:pimeloyl-ACP methyl ester carboxylesterase
MAHADVNGIRLHFEEWGRGTPVLIIPGIPAVVSDCAGLAEGLADRFRVVAFDNRGSGQSTKPDEPYSIGGFAADATGLLDTLGIGRAHVVGFSMGGMIAQELAIAAPDRLIGLVLACTHAGLKHATPPSPAAAEAFRLDARSWAERMRVLAPFAFSPGYARRHPEAFETFVEKKSRDEQPDFAYRRQLAASVRHDTLARLCRITVPTLVITGSDDAVVPAANSRLLADRIPDARLVVVPGAGHLFFAERPTEAVDAIKAFLLAAEGVRQ